jgi:MFS family permease
VSTCGQGVIADAFPPAMRGLASGVFIVPMMLGPILGPVLGGGLSQALGWRATFVALVIYGGAILVALFFLLPETHQV